MPLKGPWKSRFIRARIGKIGTYLTPFGRTYSTSLPARSLVNVHYSIFNYRYRGIPLAKSPFDLALFSMLIDQLQPRTIVEIGTLSGGSALWFADQTRVRGLETHVFSLDHVQMAKVEDPRIAFLTGDIHHLEDSDLPRILQDCPRPLLVTEDGPHTREASRSALDFFDRYLQPGEYIVVEDGVARDLGLWWYKNGPNKAVRDFLAARGDFYEVDRAFCDFFGRNVTWSPNAFLRRSS